MTNNIIEIISMVLGSSIVTSIVTFFTTRKRYVTEIEQLETDNFTKVVDRYQQIANDLQERYEKSEIRYNDLIVRYNELMDINLKLQGDIQTLKIQIRKMQEINKGV